MNDQALRDYFEFDEDDLAANRNSEFSARQKQKIASDYKDISKDGLKLGLPTAALAVILLLVNIIFFRKLGSDAIATVVFMLVCAGLGYLGLRSAYKTRKVDFSKFMVRKVAGPVRIEPGHYGNCIIHIREEEFDVDEKLASFIKDGDTYTIYLDSRDNEVLSVEGLSNK
jgi:hypothetical protein